MTLMSKEHKGKIFRETCIGNDIEIKKNSNKNLLEENTFNNSKRICHYEIDNNV